MTHLRSTLLLFAVVGIIMASPSYAQEPGDFDDSGFVDELDLDVFVNEAHGPDLSPPTSVADLDSDNDVDLEDFVTLQLLAGHTNVLLRNSLGVGIRVTKADPYSTRKTCGISGCHDLDSADSHVNAYHFQHGRTDEAGQIIVRDDYFDDGRFFMRSAGKYGKMRQGCAYSEASQLAAKSNATESEMDKTSFYWVGQCGICHPGGGPAEFDRSGFPYYDATNGAFGYHLTGENPSRHGDYTYLDPATGVVTPAPWDRTGVAEPDCLLCHRSDKTIVDGQNMNWFWRAATLRAKENLLDSFDVPVPAFMAAATAGQGWFSTLDLAEVGDDEPPLATRLQINYAIGVNNGSLVLNPDNTVSFARTSRTNLPPDYACWGCHGEAEKLNRGQVWFDADWDVHFAFRSNLHDADPSNDLLPERSTACNRCHPGDDKHRIAKGNSFAGTVKDETDYKRILTCRQCHIAGPDRDLDAPEYPGTIKAHETHDRLSCQFCHIPYAANSAELIIDNATTGTPIRYSTADFLSADPLDPTIADKTTWYPGFKVKEDIDGKERFFPVKTLFSIWWGDWDDGGTPDDYADDVIAPIPLWRVRQITGNAPIFVVTDDDGDGRPEVNRPAEIITYMAFLKGMDAYGNQVAAKPVLVKAGRVYYEDAGGPSGVSSFAHEEIGIPVESMHPFGMDHNVLPASMAWGAAEDCDACHREDGLSPVFDRLILVDPWDETTGQPVYQPVRDAIDIAPYHGESEIPLKDAAGNILTAGSTVPYSPRQTCGTVGCHDLDSLAGQTNGYHHQQGRTDASGAVVVTDDYYGDGRTFVRSAGMYGKHWHGHDYAEASELAGKTNAGASQIDKTSFYWVGQCGACHAGGGPAEFDRDGYKYYNVSTDQFGWELSGRTPTLDGDYALIDPATGALSSAPWNVTGVSEPDCLYCHRKHRNTAGDANQNWIWRAATIRAGAALVDDADNAVPAYAAATVAGQGWISNIELATTPEGVPPKATRVQIDYAVGVTEGSLEVNESNQLAMSPGSITGVPRDYACWGCHQLPDRAKRGQEWFADFDIHYAYFNNLNDDDVSNNIPPEDSHACNACHTGGESHNTTKGNSTQGTVRDELDYEGFRTCRDCHLRGGLNHPDAPLPVNDIHDPVAAVGNMMEFVSCQFCHIPYVAEPADLVIDTSVTGTTITYKTSEFLSADPLNPNDPDKSVWHPAMIRKPDKGGDSRIFPVKYLINIWWGDWDQNGTPADKSDDVIAPIPLWKIRQLTGGGALGGVTDDNGDGKLEVNRLPEINTYIQALKGNDSYGQPIATNPVLVKGRRVWYEDSGQASNVNFFEYGDTGIALEAVVPYGIDHNVRSATEGLGVGSGSTSFADCGQCHRVLAGAMFVPVTDNWVLVDPFGPEYTPEGPPENPHPAGWAVYERASDIIGGLRPGAR